MKRLRFQFAFFFLLLALALGFLLINSYRQMGLEERDLWEGESEKVYNQMQARISEFLNQEDARSFSEYRYYQVLPGPALRESSRTVSPLSETLPDGDPRGLLGYFQIDPDGSFSTPYLPRGEGRAPVDQTRRKGREDQIEGITRSLRQEVLADARASKGAEKPIFPNADSEKKRPVEQEVSLSRSESFGVASGAAPNIYPNPLEQRKEDVEKAKKSEMAQEQAPAPTPPAAKAAAPAEKLARRQVSPSPLQLKTFEEQSQGALSARGSSDELAEAKPPPSSIPSEEMLQRAMGGRSQESKEGVSVLVDPFQARLVSDQSLVFYRKIWLEQKMYLQGFVVQLTPFYHWLMGSSFVNSGLIQFASANLELGNTPLARFGAFDFQGIRKVLFERALGYPLNRFAWRVYFQSLPKMSARFYLNLLTGLIALLATGGLYFIYRSAAAEVRLSQKRQDFVSAVTHELKTPLTSIRMYSEMLEDGWVKEEPKRQEYFRHINKESGRLSRLIDNVLQLARLEKRNYKLQLKRSSPELDFEELARDLKKIAEPKGFHFSWSVADSVSPISYDPEALKEVLLILLDNSMKFASEASDKSIETNLFQEEDFVVWEWKDRGPGIPKTDLKKVFEKFYRVENELTRNTKGTGIGLAMARMIVESMGGRIEARNREGGGLVVRMNFPV
jgi:two-component system, OmpR family, phosphate regulon sensor histidine kinase PhoR